MEICFLIPLLRDCLLFFGLLAFYMLVFERAAKYIVGCFLTWARPYERCFWIRLGGWWFGASGGMCSCPAAERPCPSLKDFHLVCSPAY